MFSDVINLNYIYYYYFNYWMTPVGLLYTPPTVTTSKLYTTNLIVSNVTLNSSGDYVCVGYTQAVATLKVTGK